MKINLYTFLIIGILVLGALVRLIALSHIPLSLNIDETALGYNAYSLMRTGADEWGRFLPLSLRSFGDWKLPVYPVFTIPWIYLFGLNEFSVRFLSSISGIISIFLIYKIAAILFENKKIAVLSAFFFAISPWSIFFSRIAFEPNVGIAFILAAFLLILMHIYQKRPSYFLLGSALLLGLTFFTYHSFFVFTPFFIFLLFLLYRKKIHINRYSIASFAVIAIFFATFLLSMLGGSASKTTTVTLFNDPNLLYQRVDQLRGDGSDTALTLHLLHNKYLGVLFQMGINYTSSFSPEFLLDGKGAKDFASMRVFGYIYLVDVLFILSGIAALLWQRNKKAAYPLLGWLLIAPLPSTIARESPSATRLIGMLPILVILSASGAYSIWQMVKRTNRVVYYTVSFLLLIVFLWNVGMFADAYIYHMNIHQAPSFHYGYKQAVELTNRYPTKKVVMVGPENFPYISFLFYNHYDPVTFRKEVVYYPAKEGEFNLVKSFGRYTFVKSIDTTHLEKNTIYIDNAAPDERGNVIAYPNGDAKFKYTIR